MNRNSEGKDSRSYRSEIRIIRDILSALNVPVMRGLRKTRLLYAANLNTTMGNIYVKRLLCSRLITLDGDSTYKLTSKGARVLGLLNTIISELEREDDGWELKASKVLQEASGILGMELTMNVVRKGVLGTHRIDALIDPEGDNPVPVMLAESLEDINNIMPWLLLAMLDLGYHRGIVVVRGRSRVRSISINSIILSLVEMSEPNINTVLRTLRELGTPGPSAS